MEYTIFFCGTGSTYKSVLSMIHTSVFLKRLALRRWKHLFQAGLLMLNPCLKIMFFHQDKDLGSSLFLLAKVLL